MSQYLAAHIEDSYLPAFGNCEGQFAPAVKNMMRVNPWSSDSDFDWQFIKKEWDMLAISQSKSSFIECSPPNMVRVSSILKVFEDCKYIFSISSPYSFVASHIYNYYIKDNRFGDSVLKFDNAIVRSTKNWIQKASTQKNNIELYAGGKLRITYEEFCANPIKLLDLLDVEYLSASTQASGIKGKNNSKISEIIDMSAKHLAFLGVDGILKANSILEKSMDLVEWYNYSLVSISDANNVLSQNMLLALDGQRRRNDFDQKMKRVNARIKSTNCQSL